MSDSIVSRLLDLLRRYTTTADIQLSDFISRDLGIVGENGIELVFDIEEEFGTDLSPFMAAHAKPMARRWIDLALRRKEGPLNVDVTVEELAEWLNSNSGADQFGKHDT